ncbi:hypothetical protein JCM11251_005402 [Rhodosporidiobolus azoricus]
MPSLVLAESAVAAPNVGSHTLTAAVLDARPLLVAAAGARVDLLDESCSLVQSLPLEEAFPGQRDDAKVDAVAVDVTTGRIAAISAQRVAVWARRGPGWRVHSSYKVPHLVTALNFVQGKIVAAGEGLTLWEVDEVGAFPVWKQIASLSLPLPVVTSRLSPSACVLATVAVSSSTVLLHSIQPPSSASPTPSSRLSFRSRAAHSVRIRSVSWRPSDDVADSGPVLFTQTIDGAFRIWGSMIDEPSFFSLWATLNVHSTLPKHLPLTTLYWRTNEMDGRKEGTGGTEDQFVTVFSDGSVGLTTVSNFDSRPPTCLTQTTALLQEAVFTTASQLASLRHAFLLPSRSQTSSSFHLIGRSSRSTLVHARATLPLRDSGPMSKLVVFRDAPTMPAVSLVGGARKLVPTLRGEAVLSLGEKRIQCWELGEEALITETFVSELDALEEEVGVATWRNGRMIALAQNDTLRVFEFRQNGRLCLIASLPIHTTDTHSGPIYTTPLAFFAARRSEDSLTTALVYISHSGAVRTFLYHAAGHVLEPVSASVADLTHALPSTAHLLSAVPIPPPLEQEERDEIALLAVDSEGTLYRWSASLSSLEDGWTVEDAERGKEGVKTGLRGIERVAVAADGTSAIVAVNADGTRTLSIWDPKVSEFSSGKQFERELDAPVVALSWSLDARLLAVATPSRAELLCAQLFDDLSGASSWSCCATITIDDVLPAPLTSLTWLSAGLCLAAADHLFFYSPKLKSTTQNIHQLAADRVAPLPLHHPQLLFHAILQGHFDAVVQILANLAAELTEDGHLTPLPTTNAAGKVRKEKLTLNAFLAVPGALAKKIHAPAKAKNDVFAALTTSSSRIGESSRPTFTEEDLGRLLSALRKQSLKGLTKLEHEHLAVLAQTVLETQARKSSLDENGLRFLVSLRSFYLYHSATVSPAALSSTAATLNGPLVSQRLKYRDMVWAFHSDSQDLLLEEATKACGGKLTWEKARILGLGLWLKSPEVLARTMETIGRTEFTKPDAEDRDPITAMLFYLALKKLHIVQTFWRQSTGHSDQRQMIKFLANDFDEQRWKSAANKNAYALLSKQRFLFAAAFFLLGNSLKDAVSVILRQVNDFQLAIVIARTYEGGDDGPVLRFILDETVIPLAFKGGYRWLASWAFWLLKRRDLAVQVIVTPLQELATRLPYRLETVQNPRREDPALVLLFSQLRSWSLQTVKGAIAVSPKTEFNFVLHISRILCRMGCHLLALNLLRNWRFIAPSARQSTSTRRPNPLAHRRDSLLLSSTKLDLPLASSDPPTRVGSPVHTRNADDDAAERERQRQQFREVINTVKVEAKAQPAEFSFDAFGF